MDSMNTMETMERHTARLETDEQSPVRKDAQPAGSATPKAIKTVYVCGRGAVGMVYGDLLEKALPAEDFAFLCDEERAARYNGQPVWINDSPRQFRILSVADTPLKGVKTADLIVFACKSYSLDAAMEEAAPFLDEHTVLMSAINGISSEDRLQKRFPDNPVIHTIAQGMDARYDAAAQRETFSTRGELVFGAITPELEAYADQIEALFIRKSK